MLWRRDTSLVPVRNRTTVPSLSGIYPNHYAIFVILTHEDFVNKSKLCSWIIKSRLNVGCACVFETSKVPFLKLYKIMAAYTTLLRCVNWTLRKQHDGRTDWAEMKFLRLVVTYTLYGHKYVRELNIRNSTSIIVDYKCKWTQCVKNEWRTPSQISIC